MAPTDSTHDLHQALTRIAGKPIRKARHGLIYRIVVVSNDGKRCAVQLGPVSNHRARPSTATLNEIADLLRVSRDQLEQELARSAEDVVARLEGFSAEDLKPPASAIHRAPGS